MAKWPKIHEKVINFIAVRAGSCNHNEMSVDVSDEGDQVPSGQEKSTLYCVPFCLKYILHHTFISSGLKKEINLH